MLLHEEAADFEGSVTSTVMPSHTPPTQTYQDSNLRDSTSHTRSCDVIALMGAMMGVVGEHATVATSESLLLSSMLTCERVRTNERQRMQPLPDADLSTGGTTFILPLQNKHAHSQLTSA
jgi:hypothetical protein